MFADIRWIDFHKWTRWYDIHPVISFHTECIVLMKRIRKVKHTTNSEYFAAPLRKNEFNILGNFPFEAIFIPEGIASPEKEIIYQPELQVYISDFGKIKVILD